MMKGLFSIIICLCSIATFAAKWCPARIDMSDGNVLKGKVAIMGSRPLVVTPLASRYGRKIQLRDIISITQVVEEQKMNRPWMYKEAGKTDKVYGEGTYPFLNFITEVLLTNGEVVRGYVVSVPFKFKGKGPRKIFLSRQIKGKVGQTFDDVPYPVKIEVPNSLAKVEPIKGKIIGYGKIEKVAALDNERGVVSFAELKGDSFVLNNLLPATYDIFILTDTYAVIGFSGQGPASKKGKTLPADSLTGLNKVFPKADDFFPKRWILNVKGNTAFAKTLVYKRREKFYHSHKHTPDGFMWHLDVWSWHLAGKEWKIDKRYVMLRHKQKGTENIRKLVSVKDLQAVKPGTEISVNHKDHIDGEKLIRNLD